MDLLYKKLNRKLDDLTQLVNRDKKPKEHTHTHTHIYIYTEDNKSHKYVQGKTFTREQLDTMKLGPQYAIERNPKQYINVN